MMQVFFITASTEPAIMTIKQEVTSRVDQFTHILAGPHIIAMYVTLTALAIVDVNATSDVKHCSYCGRRVSDVIQTSHCVAIVSYIPVKRIPLCSRFSALSRSLSLFNTSF